jgi:hypothetical protein
MSVSKPYQLTFDDAVAIWLRSWAGAFQHTIAAQYGVNPGRVNDVLKGRKHSGARAIAEKKRGMAA